MKETQETAEAKLKPLLADTRLDDFTRLRKAVAAIYIKFDLRTTESGVLIINNFRNAVEKQYSDILAKLQQNSNDPAALFQAASEMDKLANAIGQNSKYLEAGVLEKIKDKKEEILKQALPQAEEIFKKILDEGGDPIRMLKSAIILTDDKVDLRNSEAGKLLIDQFNKKVEERLAEMVPDVQFMDLHPWVKMSKMISEFSNKEIGDLAGRYLVKNESSQTAIVLAKNKIEDAIEKYFKIQISAAAGYSSSIAAAPNRIMLLLDLAGQLGASTLPDTKASIIKETIANKIIENTDAYIKAMESNVDNLSLKGKSELNRMFELNNLILQDCSIQDKKDSLNKSLSQGGQVLLFPSISSEGVTKILKEVDLRTLETDILEYLKTLSSSDYPEWEKLKLADIAVGSYLSKSSNLPNSIMQQYQNLADDYSQSLFDQIKAEGIDLVNALDIGQLKAFDPKVPSKTPSVLALDQYALRIQNMVRESFLISNPNSLPFAAKRWAMMAEKFRNEGNYIAYETIRTELLALDNLAQLIGKKNVDRLDPNDIQNSVINEEKRLLAEGKDFIPSIAATKKLLEQATTDEAKNKVVERWEKAKSYLASEPQTGMKFNYNNTSEITILPKTLQKTVAGIYPKKNRSIFDALRQTFSSSNKPDPRKLRSTTSAKAPPSLNQTSPPKLSTATVSQQDRKIVAPDYLMKVLNESQNNNDIASGLTSHSKNLFEKITAEDISEKTRKKDTKRESISAIANYTNDLFSLVNNSISNKTKGDVRDAEAAKWLAIADGARNNGDIATYVAICNGVKSNRASLGAESLKQRMTKLEVELSSDGQYKNLREMENSLLAEGKSVIPFVMTLTLGMANDTKQADANVARFEKFRASLESLQELSSIARTDSTSLSENESDLSIGSTTSSQVLSSQELKQVSKEGIKGQGDLMPDISPPPDDIKLNTTLSSGLSSAPLPTEDDLKQLAQQKNDNQMNTVSEQLSDASSDISERESSVSSRKSSTTPTLQSAPTQYVLMKNLDDAQTPDQKFKEEVDSSKKQSSPESFTQAREKWANDEKARSEFGAKNVVTPKVPLEISKPEDSKPENSKPGLLIKIMNGIRDLFKGSHRHKKTTGYSATTILHKTIGGHSVDEVIEKKEAARHAEKVDEKTKTVSKTENKTEEKVKAPSSEEISEMLKKRDEEYGWTIGSRRSGMGGRR